MKVYSMKDLQNLLNTVQATIKPGETIRTVVVLGGKGDVDLMTGDLSNLETREIIIGKDFVDLPETNKFPLQDFVNILEGIVAI